jgi:DNA ligase-1
METVTELPTLYSISSKGKTKQWSVKVIQDEDTNVYVVSTHGYVGCKLVDEMSSSIKGKNVGRKNETTPVGQAFMEARSKWQSKLDKNYQETIPTSIEEFQNIRPMLAHKYHERKHNIVFPCYVQPKLNGVRCLAEECVHIKDPSTFLFTSRGGKDYNTLSHIGRELAQVTTDMFDLHEDLIFNAPFDGEIFNPDMPFEDISSAVKKDKENTRKLQYWIYDIADTNLAFSDRLVLLNEMAGFVGGEGSSIVIVPTFEVQNEEELMEYHRKFSLEYEGTMVRNKHGKYIYDFRSTDLLKLKDFLDEEFLIIGGKAGTGSDSGTVVFKCITKDKKEFDVRPRGTRDQRKDWYEELERLLGKWLTIRFQDYSETGVPIFPVGIGIRELPGSDFM